jgi:hypothetical protein
MAFHKCYKKQFVADLSQVSEKVTSMFLKVAIRVVQLQFFALCVYLLCDWLAGPKDAVLWFVTVSLVLLMGYVWGMVTRYRHR